MLTIADIREQYPDYNDLSDTELADSIHEKFYSDLPKEDVYRKLGVGPETSITGTLKHGAERGVAPAAAAMVGAGAGAAAGSVVPVVGTIVGALVGGGLAAYGASELQEKLLDILPEGLKKAVGQDAAQRAAEGDQHPVATAISELAPQLLTMRPGALIKAGVDASKLEQLMSHPIASRLIGAGLTGGLEAGQEQGFQGELDPTRIAIATAAGAILNKPTTLGAMLERSGARIFGGVKSVARPGEVVPLEQTAEANPTAIDFKDATRILQEAGLNPTDFSDPVAVATRIQNNVGRNITKDTENANQVPLTAYPEGPVRPGADVPDYAPSTMRDVARNSRLGLPPPKVYDTALGRLDGPQIDEILTSNRHIPEVDDVAQATNLPIDVRRTKGIEAVARNPETAVKLPKRGGEAPQAQSPKTPLEAGMGVGALSKALTGEEARLYSRIKNDARRGRLGDSGTEPSETPFEQVPPNSKLPGPPEQKLLEAPPKRLTGPAEAVELPTEHLGPEATGKFTGPSDSIQREEFFPETPAGDEVTGGFSKRPLKASPEATTAGPLKAPLNEQQRSGIRDLISEVSGKKADVAFGSSKEVGQAFKEVGGEYVGDIGGYYDPSNDVIAVAHDRGALEARETAWHELQHLGERHLYNDEEMAAQVRDRDKLNDVAQRTVGPEVWNSIPAKSRDYEGRAIAGAVYQMARDGIKPMPKEFSPPVKRGFERVRQFLNRLKSLVGIKKPMQAHEAFEKLRSGELAKRALDRASPEHAVAQAIPKAEENIKKSVSYKKASDIGNWDALTKHLTAIRDKFPKSAAYVNGVFKRQDISSRIRATVMRPFFDLVSNLGKEDRVLLARAGEAAEAHPFVHKPNAAGDILIEALPKNFDGHNTHLEMSRPGDVITIPKRLVPTWTAKLKAYGDMREEIVKSLIARGKFPEGSTPETLKALGTEKAENLAGLIETLRQHVNYNPHVRFGNKVIDVKEKTFNPDGSVKPVSQWKTVHLRGFDLLGRNGSLLNKFHDRLSDRQVLGMGQYRRARAVLESQYRNADPANPKYDISVHDFNYDDIKRMIGNPVGDLRSVMDIFSDGDPEAMGKMLDDLDTALTMKGMKAHLGQRENIPGWIHHDNASTYDTRAMSNYVVKGAGFVARNHTNEEIQNALKSVREANLPNLFNTLRQHEDYLNNGTEEYQALRNIAFLYFLGGNFSSAAINATQVLHTTVPVLTGAAGSKRALPAIASGVKDTLKILGNNATFKKLLSGDPYAIMSISKPSSMTVDEWTALQNTIKSGEVLPMQSLDQAAVTVGSHEGLTGIRRGLQRTSQTLASMFGAAEAFNRMSTFIAAYRLASAHPELLKNSVKDIGAKADTAEDYARQAVVRTQFNMSKVNRPQFMQGKLSVPTQFMSYPVQMLELASHMAFRQGAEGKKALAMMLAAMVTTSGLWSFPGADNAKDLTEAVYKFATQKNINIDGLLREAMAEIDPRAPDIISRGLLPSMTDISLAGRVGAGQIINPQMLSGSVENMTGPAGGMLLGNTAAALEYHRQGRDNMAVASMFPTALRNVLKAFDVKEEGFRSAKGTVYKTPQDTTAGDILRQGLGFTPEKVGRRMEESYQLQRLGNSLDQLQLHYNDRLANVIMDQQRASRAGNADGAKDAGKELADTLQEIREYNKDKRPEDTLKISQATIRQKVAQAMTGRPSLKSIPTRMRGAAHNLQSLYNTE